MSERDIMLEIQKHASEIGMRLWRNNCGAHKLPNGTWLKYGVCNPGGSDLLGITKVKITPDMVGKEVAVFTAVEVKTRKGRASEAQEAFISFVKSWGGISGISRSPEELDAMCKTNG